MTTPDFSESFSDSQARLEPPVFEPRRFNEITMGDANLQRMLVASFLKELPSMRAGLRAACSVGGRDFSDALHRLKSSSHFVAGLRVSDRVARLEAGKPAATEHERDGACALVGVQLELLEQALRAFAQGLPGGAPVR